MDASGHRTAAPSGWTLTSWRNLPIKQQPKYADEAALEAALEEGASTFEVRDRRRIAECASHIGETRNSFCLSGKSMKFDVFAIFCTNGPLVHLICSVHFLPSLPALPTFSLCAVRRLPPLVAPSEVDALRSQLAEVAEGKRFLLQGGDCAERFVDCAAEPIEAKLRILLQMSLVLTWGARIPTLRIARMAGQFSKPRSKDTETLPDGSEVTAFRGDNVNSFDLSARTPDPSRLVSGYFHSAATLNYARSLLSAG